MKLLFSIDGLRKKITNDLNDEPQTCGRSNPLSPSRPGEPSMSRLVEAQPRQPKPEPMAGNSKKLKSDSHEALIPGVFAFVIVIDDLYNHLKYEEWFVKFYPHNSEINFMFEAIIVAAIITAAGKFISGRYWWNS